MNLYEKYNNKKLSTDEYAVALNEIKEEIDRLENIELTTGEGHILLKWGTLKSCDFKDEKSKELFKEYCSIGSSVSAMSQKDTERQKEIICELIDLCEGVLQEDWNGKYLTKKEAKEYVMNYNSN